MVQLLVWENNELQGAWGIEGKIHCHSNLVKFTAPLKRKFTKGRAKIVLHRINCNEFVQDLVNTHKFSMGSIQNTVVIRSTIPAPYLIDFDRGLAL